MGNCALDLFSLLCTQMLILTIIIIDSLQICAVRRAMRTAAGQLVIINIETIII